MKKTAFVILAFLMTASCTTTRLNLDHSSRITEEKLSKIEIGVSSKEDIESIFGPPMDKLEIKTKEAWFYKDFNLRPLLIEFDEIGRVKTYRTDK